MLVQGGRLIVCQEGTCHKVSLVREINCICQLDYTASGMLREFVGKDMGRF